jgi:HEAT repeat protein
MSTDEHSGRPIKPSHDDNPKAEPSLCRQMVEPFKGSEAVFSGIAKKPSTHVAPDGSATNQDDSQHFTGSPKQEVTELIGQLQGPDTGSKKGIIDVLADLGPEAGAAVPVLINLLSDRDETVRKSAINALGKIGPRARLAIPSLFGTLNAPDREIRRMSGDALLSIDPEAGVLVDALSRSELNIREGAHDALWRISPGTKAAIPKLVKALNHADGSIRHTAVKALGRIGSSAVPALIYAAKDPIIGYSAITALSNVRPSAAEIPILAEVIKGPDWSISFEAINALAKIGPAAVPALTDALLHSAAASVRRTAAHALGGMRAEAKESVSALITALGDDEANSDAADALGMIGPDAQEAIPALVGALKQEDRDFRMKAVYALGGIGSAAVPALIGALAHADGGVRQGAADALRRIGPSANASLPALIKALKDKLEGVRMSAARALMAIIPDTKEAVTILMETVADEDKSVRDGIAKGVHAMGSSAIAALIDALKDQKESVRTCATDALAQGGLEAVPALMEALKCEQGIRKNVVKALQSIAETLTYIKIPTGLLASTEGEIDLRQLDHERLRELSRESPLAFEYLSKYLFKDGIREYLDLGDMDFSACVVPVPEPLEPVAVPEPLEPVAVPEPLEPVGTSLRKLEGKIQALQKVIDPIWSALEELQRYTDLTIYEGHLYPSDDLRSANRLGDEIPLNVGNPYTLEVAIRLKRTGIGADQDSPRGVKNPRQDQEELTVYVLAESNWSGIEILEPFAKIRWPYNTDSESALFRLDVKPVERDDVWRGKIEVRLYSHSLDLLDIVGVFVTVVRPDLESRDLRGLRPQRLLWPDKEPGVPHIDPKAPPRRLSIHVTSRCEGGYRFTFVFPRPGVGDIEVPVMRDIRVEDFNNLLARVRDFWTDLVITNYAGQLSVTRTTFGKYLSKLADLGKEAWCVLFGTRYGDQAGASETLGELLSTMELGEGTHIQITCSGTCGNFIFPWSILYPPTGDQGVVDPLRFWGARYQIEQVTTGPKLDALTDEPISVLFALDPGFGNAALQKELLKRYQTTAHNKLVVTDPISDQQTLFKELTRNPSSHLVYFYCHGYASTRPSFLDRDGVKLLKQRIEALSDESPERQALETLLTLTAKMGDESWMYIGGSEIRESELKRQRFFFEKRRPIVFLNMCQSAHLLPSMSSGLVRVFLDHNASAVVGTESPMTAVFANAFAKAVFDALFGGDDIGTALWKARRCFLDEMRNPLGLAYTLYGRATARLGTNPLITAATDSNLNPAVSNQL